MSNSSTPSFTNLLLSSNSSLDAENTRSSQQASQQQPSFPPSFPMSFPPQQFSNNFHPYPPNWNPYAAQAGYQQFHSSGFPFHGNFGGFHPGMDMAGGPSSPVGSAASLGALGGSGGLRADECSPISSPVVPVENTNRADVIEEWSDVDSDEGKKAERKWWSKDDNKRLIQAWLNNSVDPIDGNSKKGAHYWKDVAAEYNMGAPKGHKRTAMQLKNHWNTHSTIVSKFHGAWTTMKNTYASGQSDQQLMDKAQAEYMEIMQTDKPFKLDYWWHAVKDEPKWLNRDVLSDMNKRNKVSASGAYTSSSNRDTDEGSVADRPRPPGQKQAKAQKQGKGKGKSTLTDENVGQFNVLQERKSEAIETMAAAAGEHAQAIASKAAADKERVKLEKMKHLHELMQTDTSTYSQIQMSMHEKMMLSLSDEIYRED